MNQKTAKLLRRYCSAKSMPLKEHKKRWVSLSPLTRAAMRKAMKQEIAK